MGRRGQGVRERKVGRRGKGVREREREGNWE